MENGTRLGPYEILEQLGAGGMGEVWLAEDSRLGRKVAIKVLPAEFSNDPERLARFEQEARAAAALNHPHIAVVHDFGVEGETHFMVQEFLDGNTLREPLEKGALPLKRTLSLAAEIAEGLAAAHDVGITHRDLKPENLFVTIDGHIKILDFGLAKLTEGTLLASGSASMSPTRLGTAAGQIMGTAGYMAPEQVEAAPDIDSRADVFAFGCLLYEMATGRHPFAGKNAVQTLDRIVNEEAPPVGSIAPDLPEKLQWTLDKCLAKEPAERYQTARDLVIDLRGLAAEVEAGTAMTHSGATGTATGHRTVPLITAVAAGVALVAVTGLLTWQWAVPEEPAAAEVVRFSLRLPEGLYLWGGDPDEARIGGHRPSEAAMAVSPDGRTIVYAATDGGNAQLYSRQLDAPAAVPIAGTEGGSRPFFSADGQTIGFRGPESDIRVVPREGGISRLLFAEPATRDGNLQWTEAEDVLFIGPGSAVWRYPTRGGGAEALVTPSEDAGELAFTTPWQLPGDGAVLYTVMRRARDWASVQLVVRRREAAASEVLLTGASSARYVPTGHLVFARDGALWATGFDPQDLRTRGEPVPVLEEVMHAIEAGNSSIDSGAAQYDVSSSGTLAYVTGGKYEAPLLPLFWVGTDGERELVEIDPSNYMYPRLSPDERYFAIRTGPESDGDILVFEVATRATRRLRLDGNQSTPVWSADGARIAFRSNHEAPNLGIFSIDASLTGAPARLTSGGTTHHPESWSDDGNLLFIRGEDIWVVDTESPAEPRPLVEGEGAQHWPAFSPDGGWFVYGSNHSGEFQVYLRPFPDGEPVYPVTSAGGARPIWSHDGRKIFYRTGLNNRSRMMVVDLVADDPPRWSPPRELFDRLYLGTTQSLSYDVNREGRFLMVENFSYAEQKATEIQVVLNWFEELKQLVPTVR